MLIMKHLKKLKKKSLNILNYTIILNECTLPLVIFLLPNLKNKIHIITLTLCPQKLDISTTYSLIIMSNFLGAYHIAGGCSSFAPLSLRTIAKAHNRWRQPDNGCLHESEDEKYLIMFNGSRAFAIPSGDAPSILSRRN